jgi:protein subunit release factor B
MRVISFVYLAKRLELLLKFHKNRSIVKILPEQYATDRESLERDSDLEFFIASGPGGQHRNKVETGVRLTHRPSGISVTATERRSQHANREVAFERMAARLEEMQHISPPRKPTRPTAASRERRLEEKRRSAMRKKQRATSLDE